MAKDKKSFVAYADWIEEFDMLSDEEAGKLIKHLLAYVNDLDPVLEDRVLKFAFQPMKKQLKRDLEKYENTCKKRAEAGKKGGKKTQSKAKQASASIANQNQANQADNDNDSDNDSDSDSQSEREYARAFDFLKIKYPGRFEQQFQMRYSKKIKDKKKFVQAFNNKCDTEEREYKPRVLFARLDSFASNWIENQDKYNKENQSSSNQTSKIPIG